MAGSRQPLVSIIIPTYKRSVFLKRSIDSVLNQSYENLEIIVVDDNDQLTDYRKDTEKIMEAYEKYDNVRYIKHEKNKNGSAARNTGLRNSKGEYIEFLDDDDYYLPDKTAEEVTFLENHPEFQAVYCGRVQNGVKICGKFNGDLSKIMLVGKFMPTTPALMFRAENIKKINGFNENFRRHQEVEMLLRFFDYYRIGSLPKPLVVIKDVGRENELHGEALENNKNLYLNTFKLKIEALSKYDNKYKDMVYMKHYSDIVCDHLQNGYYRRFLKIYLKGVRISLLRFNSIIIKHIFEYLRYILVGKHLKRVG